MLSDSPDLALPEIPLRPLRTRLLRDLLWAPEFERFLGVDHLDLSLLDQIDSVKVRLVTGLGILERRILASLAAALRRQMWTCAVIGIMAGAAIAAVAAASKYYPPLCVTVAVVMASGASLGTARWVSLRADMKLLQRLHRRYEETILSCGEMEPLLAVARVIESEVRTLAARDGEKEERAAKGP